jgi:hypothetical protein
VAGHRKQAAYVLLVKANQPALHQQLKALPWRELPVADHTRDRGHHRMEPRHRRSPPWLAWDSPTPPRRFASPAGSGPCTAAAGAW